MNTHKKGHFCVKYLKKEASSKDSSYSYRQWKTINVSIHWQSVKRAVVFTLLPKTMQCSIGTLTEMTQFHCAAINQWKHWNLSILWKCKLHMKSTKACVCLASFYNTAKHAAIVLNENHALKLCFICWQMYSLQQKSKGQLAPFDRYFFSVGCQSAKKFNRTQDLEKKKFNLQNLQYVPAKLGHILLTSIAHV